MSPIEKRSLGFPFNEQDLIKELANGVSGYDAIEDNTGRVYDHHAVARYHKLEALADIGLRHLLCEFQDDAHDEPAAIHNRIIEAPLTSFDIGRVALAA